MQQHIYRRPFQGFIRSHSAAKLRHARSTETWMPWRTFVLWYSIEICNPNPKSENEYVEVSRALALEALSQGFVDFFEFN